MSDGPDTLRPRNYERAVGFVKWYDASVHRRTERQRLEWEEKQRQSDQIIKMRRDEEDALKTMAAEAEVDDRDKMDK